MAKKRKNVKKNTEENAKSMESLEGFIAEIKSFLESVLASINFESALSDCGNLKKLARSTPETSIAVPDPKNMVILRQPRDSSQVDLDQIDEIVDGLNNLIGNVLSDVLSIKSSLTGISEQIQSVKTARANIEARLPGMLASLEDVKSLSDAITDLHEDQGCRQMEIFDDRVEVDGATPDHDSATALMSLLANNDVWQKCRELTSSQLNTVSTALGILDATPETNWEIKFSNESVKAIFSLLLTTN